MNEPATTRPWDGELAILQVLREGGPCTVRAVLGRIGRARGTGYTILKLMQIMAATAWLTTPPQVQADDPPATVHGRVLDEAGRPVAAARLRLYRRVNRWERRNQMVEETKSGTDGAYRLTTPVKPAPRNDARSRVSYVLVADHPGKAVGWKTAPGLNDAGPDDVVLTSPIERTISVVDRDGRPVADAMVIANAMGDDSSPRTEFQDILTVRPDDGPLTTVTGADGRATLHQLPNTKVSFIAAKPGFAENVAFSHQDTIHLTPSASLSGTVTGPDGRPLAGVEVVLFTKFMWHFERTATDAEGRYQFEGLRPRDWDMSAWRPGQKGNGRYKVWLDDGRFAVPTTTLTLEPNTKPTLDLQAVEAGVVRVTVVEADTHKPMAGVGVSGFDAEPSVSNPGLYEDGRRFQATTDERGQARFRAHPSRISLSAMGPPEGRYLEGNLMDAPEAHAKFDFPGGEVNVRLVIPPTTGALISVAGACSLPDDAPAENVSVAARGGRFLTASTMSLIPTRRTDRRGFFTLQDVPAGRMIRLYAETQDRTFAAATTFQAPDKENLGARLSVKLVPTVTATRQFVGVGAYSKAGVARKIEISPMVEGEEFVFSRRVVELDAEGRTKIDGIVPGLSYRINDVTPRPESPAGVTGGEFARPSAVVEILVPAQDK